MDNLILCCVNVERHLKCMNFQHFAQIIHEKSKYVSNCPEFMFLHENNTQFSGLLKQQVKLVPFLKVRFNFKSL